MPDKAFVVFSIQGWSDMWVSKHWIASALAKYGEVYFIEPFRGIMLPGRDGRLSDFHSGPRIRQEGEVKVTTMSSLPGHYSGPGWYRALSRFSMRRQIGNLRRIIGDKDIFILTFDYRSEPIIRKFKSVRKSAYYAIDVIPDDKNDPWWPERGLIQYCDQILTTSNRHRARLVSAFGRSDIHIVPHGVDFSGASVAEDRIRPTEIPLSGPVIGYTGTIHDRYVDFPVIRDVALQNPDWNFVFIGPIQRNPLSVGASEKIELISSLPNVKLLGSRPYKDLARFIGFFDVCIMPYSPSVDNEPFKTLNYFAQGKPVVAADVPGISEYKDLLYTYRGPAGMTAALRTALLETETHAFRRKRIEYAQERDFSVISKKILDILQSAESHG